MLVKQLQREEIALETLCDHQLMEWQVARRHYIRHRTRISNALGSLVRRRLGWRYDLPEKTTAAILKQADRIVRATVGGKALTGADLGVCVEILDDLQASYNMYAVADEALQRITSEMEAAAKQLPVWSWVNGIRGAGATSLAVIVGEAGNLLNYSHPDKLKKRLGLAPFTKDGVTHAPSTWKTKGKLSADDWVEVGYSPNRLGQIYGCVTVPLRNGQLVGKAKTGEGQRQAHGKYGEIYLKRYERALQTKPEMTPAWRDMDACRVMTSAFVSDLWSEWRRAYRGVHNDATATVPAACQLEAV